MYAYAKCPISCLAHDDRVKSGTGSCLMASFPRNGLHFELRSFRDEKNSCFLPYSKPDLKNQRR